MRFFIVTLYTFWGPGQLKSSVRLPLSSVVPVGLQLAVEPSEEHTSQSTCSGSRWTVTVVPESTFTAIFRPSVKKENKSAE